MKLAAALMKRADLQNRINELQTRLNNNARVQDGEKPAESPKDLLAELAALIGESEALIAKINLVNANTVIDGRTITERIAHRDALMQKQRIMRGFLDEASNLAPRYSKTEIKIVSTVNVRQLQKELDQLAKEIRLAEENLQELNWTVDLSEE